MNFEYYLDFEDLVGLDRLRDLKLKDMTFTYGDKNNTVCSCNVKVGDYNKLHVRKSSVINSFGKVFKFLLSSGEEAICVFIPDYQFLVSSIITRDFEALRECKIWLDQLTVTIRFLDTCYMNKHIEITGSEVGLDDLELLEVIPSQFPTNVTSGYFDRFPESNEGYPMPRVQNNIFAEKTTNNGDIHDTIVKDLDNYDPSSIVRIIAKQIDNLGYDSFPCSTMLEYQVLIDSAISSDRIGLDVDHKSYSGFIEMASQNILKIQYIGEEDIIEYFIIKNKDNVENLLHINTICRSDDDDRSYNFSSSKKIIKACIKEYGSLSAVPQDLTRSIDSLYVESCAVEYVRPLIDHMVISNIPIFCRSPLFELIFPGVPTVVRKYARGNPEFGVYSEWTTDYTKEEFLMMVSEKYNCHAMGKLYDLFLKGMITKEDIIKAGLHHIYAICLWMINRIIRVKAVPIITTYQ